MEQLVDFTNCKRLIRVLGGTDRKFEVEYAGKPYIIKFSNPHVPKTDMSTSYTNNVTSEYISSHISRSIGLPTHETVLGYYGERPVVGCLDFRKPDEQNIEFKEFVRACFDPEEIKRSIILGQIYKTLEDMDVFSDELKQASIERYWDTFIVDALVGNFDRHAGNWGYLSTNNSQLILAPVYDFGSSLLPQLSDEGIGEIIDNELKMYERCLVFPSAALFVTTEKTGKVGYYDMMASGYDEECTSAVKRIAPKINMEDIYKIIDNTPIISEKRKKFYKKYLNYRKQLIVDRAYSRCITGKFDSSALERIQKGAQYSTNDLKCDMNDNMQYFEPVKIPQYLKIFPDYNNKEAISQLKNWKDTSNKADGRPSFERISQDNHLYKLYLNFPSSQNKKYELYKDGELISSKNSIRSICSDYKTISHDRHD